MKIKKGDKVRIITGKDRGKEGKIMQVLPALGKVVVDGLNIAKKSTKARKSGEKGQIVEVPMPINVSNVMAVCSKCNKTTRVGYKTGENGKVRVCKKCNVEL